MNGPVTRGVVPPAAVENIAATLIGPPAVRPGLTPEPHSRSLQAPIFRSAFVSSRLLLRDSKVRSVRMPASKAYRTRSPLPGASPHQARIRSSNVSTRDHVALVPLLASRFANCKESSFSLSPARVWYTSHLRGFRVLTGSASFFSESFGRSSPAGILYSTSTKLSTSITDRSGKCDQYRR